MKYKICQELERIKTSYDTPLQRVEGLYSKQKDIIRMIEFYSSSRYLNGQKDELGRDKAFYQVLNGICDVENAAKDIDTKDISATSDDSEHYTESFLLSKDIEEWMKRTNFAKTLNDMRDMHTRYGSLLPKKRIIKNEDGTEELEISLPEWKNLLTDQMDIPNGTIVEIHYMTPREVLKKDEWENTREAVRQVGKEYSKRITIYEVRGEFPRSWIKELDGRRIGDDDEYDFSYQLYYLAGAPLEKDAKEQGYGGLGNLIPLYWEDDTERVYKYLARKPKAGRGFGVGVFEEGEESQVWINDTVLKQFRAMEYTTKNVSQTATRKLKGRNLLTEVDDGQILEHEPNNPITPINLLPSGGLQQYQNLIMQWYTQLEKTTSAYEAQRGETPPSGTPFRLQATVLQQSSSVFKNLKQELGIFITEMFEDWIMPFLAKQLNAEHILAHNFSLDELKEIDKNFSDYHANTAVKRAVLSGKIVSPEEYETLKKAGEEFIRQTKNTRFLQIPKDYYKKFKAKITVNVTGEQQNKAAVLESLRDLWIGYNRNPITAQDPVSMLLFLRIVELSGAGISPVSLTGAIAEQAKLREEQLAQQQQLASEGSQTREFAPQERQLSLMANPAPQV